MNSLTTPQAASKKLKTLYPREFMGVVFEADLGIGLLFNSYNELTIWHYDDFTELEGEDGIYPLAKPILHDLLIAFNLAVNKEHQT